MQDTPMVIPRSDSLWDDENPLVGMPTNRKVALEQNAPEEFNLYCTDQVAAAAPPEITDQLLFQQLKGRAGTGTMIWTWMMRNPTFKDRIRANQWKTPEEIDLRFLECLHHEGQFLHRAGDSSHGNSHHRRND